MMEPWLMILKPTKTLKQVMFLINLHILFYDLLINTFLFFILTCLIFYFVEFSRRLHLVICDN
jgi:hypothetical protein